MTRQRPVAGACAFCLLVLFARFAGAATYNVTTYGAVGDGVTNNTAAIQAAIQAASGAGGGLVLIPSAASPYLSDSITLVSDLTFSIAAGATLQMEPYGTYEGGSANPPDFIYGSKLTNVVIDGGGTIDGQGAAWWAAFIANGALVRPGAMVYVTDSQSVTVTGITLQNAPMVNQQYFGDTGVLISGLTVFNPYASASDNISPNTDGMDVASTNVLIEDCNISTGDDVIAIGSTSHVADDITVTGCTFGTGHGLSIGSHTSGTVSNLWVSDCTFTGTQYGLRFKSDRGSGGLATNLNYSNLTMSAIVYYPIFLDSYYGVSTAPTCCPATDPGGPATLGTGTPQWQNITFTDISAGTVSGGGTAPMQLWGLPEAPATDILFDNVSLNGPGDAKVYNAAGVSFTCTCRINGAPVSASTVATYAATVSFLSCSTGTPSPTASPISTLSDPTASRTPTSTRTPSPTPSASPASSATGTPTRTSSPTPTSTAVSTRSPSSTSTDSPEATASPTPTYPSSPAPSGTPSSTPANSRTASVTGSPTGTSASTATPSATFSLTPAATRSATPSTTQTVASTVTVAPSPSVTLSPTAVATASPTATASATSSLSPTSRATLTATPSATLSPTASPTGSVTPSGVSSSPPTHTPVSTGVATQTPTSTAPPTAAPESSTPGPGGPLVISRAVPVPNPNPASIRVLLEGPADSVEVRVWSVSLHLLATVQSGPGGPGWVNVALPADFLAEAASGLYYFSVQAEQGGRVSRTVVGRLMVLR